MNQMTPMFASAYRQLNAAEREFVDAAIEVLEATVPPGGKVSDVLHRPIPSSIINRSRGMLDRPLVTAAITERIYQLAADGELSYHRWIREISAIGFSNVFDYVSYDQDNVPYFDFAALTPDKGAAVKKLTIKTNGGDMTMATKVEISVEFHPKMDALKMMAQHAGWVEPDNPQWKAAQAPPPDALPDTATVTQAGDEYQKYLGDAT